MNCRSLVCNIKVEYLFTNWSSCVIPDHAFITYENVLTANLSLGDKKKNLKSNLAHLHRYDSMSQNYNMSDMLVISFLHFTHFLFELVA